MMIILHFIFVKQLKSLLPVSVMVTTPSPVRVIRGSIHALVKLDTVSPAALYRCNVSSQL